MTKKKRISKLSLKFTAVVILSAVVSVSIFSLFFINRYRIFHLIMDEERIREITKEEIKKLQNDVTKQKLSVKDHKKVRKVLSKYKDLTIYIYDKDDENLIDASFSVLEKQVYIGTASFWVTLYEPVEVVSPLHFIDGDYPVAVLSFIGMNFMIRYIFLLSGICLFLFIFFIMWFVHRKMTYVLSIGEEMKLIEAGDYHHTIIYKGNDEITDLARQLHHLRNALYDNMIKEQEARDANHELVTTMSHDLRTPLTSLLGYLEILQMKIYKNEAMHDEYVQKSQQKAMQIKELSDKLFNHFLVVSKDEEIQLHPIEDLYVLDLLLQHSEELRSDGYEVITKLEDKASPWRIMGEEAMLQRVFDNLFSNLHKYADPSLIVITLLQENNSILIRFKNRKKADISHEESTKIGLKSVNKMMKQMHGSFHYENDEHEFLSLIHI